MRRLVQVRSAAADVPIMLGTAIAASAEESVDFDQVLYELTEPPQEAAREDLPRQWFKHFQSPKLLRLGHLLHRARLGRQVVLARGEEAGVEQLQVDVLFNEHERLVIDVDGRGFVRLSFAGSSAPGWNGQVERSGEAGLALFVDQVRRLSSHLERHGPKSASGVFQALGFERQTLLPF